MDVRTTQSLSPHSTRQPHVAAVPAFDAPGKSVEDAQTERLTHEAQRWVSQTFFGTLLKQMHDSPFKADWVTGGRGGEAFSTLYDQHLADRMARASGRQLVQSIVSQIQGRSAISRNNAASTGRGHAATR